MRCKARVMIDVSTLSENSIGTFDACLARPKNCPNRLKVILAVMK